MMDWTDEAQFALYIRDLRAPGKACLLYVSSNSKCWTPRCVHICSAQPLLASELVRRRRKRRLLVR